ncbi:MAG: hypothetical protein ACI89X_005114 [Planctomycetota bacterium]|jgi:hypothetical protein
MVKLWSLGLVFGSFVACHSVVVAQEAEPAAELVTEGFLYDDAKAVGFPKPLDWKFAKRKSRQITDKNIGSVSALEFTARTIEFGNFDVGIWILNGSCPTLRLQAIREQYGKVEAGYVLDGKYRLLMEPVPHASFQVAGSPDQSFLMVHRRANGRAMSVTFELSTEMLPKARQALLQLAGKIEVNLPLWPLREKGYEYESESGFEMAFAANVARKHRSAMRKLLSSIVKDFTKTHGAPVFVEGEPVVIYVEARAAKKAELISSSDQNITIDSDVGMRRIVTSVVYDADVESRVSFSAVVHRYLLSTLYSLEDTMWVHWGEELLARMKARCGKALPRAPELWLGDVQRVRANLADATADKKAGGDFADPGAWVAFFRLGPAKYRKVYQAYLHELRTGTDPAAALRTLLEACDSKKLWGEARKLLGRKLKPAKR